jgi:hypothetical protein
MKLHLAAEAGHKELPALVDNGTDQLDHQGLSQGAAGLQHTAAAALWQQWLCRALPCWQPPCNSDFKLGVTCHPVTCVLYRGPGAPVHCTVTCVSDPHSFNLKSLLQCGRASADRGASLVPELSS